ncbi:MAG: glycine betaine ABC transporter substrate-binding protein, partial [Candidatus Deferrimicrobiota bacterium]
PDQVLVANILAVFIDERTGTTVKLSRFGTRDEAFEAVRQDKISLYADYSSIILGKFAGERPAPDEGKNIARLKEVLNRKYNVVWLEPFGYDRYFSDKGKAGEKPGQAGLMLCKDALSKFPALPRLLAKLRGSLDNDTMSALLREAEKSDPKAVARRFLKSRKLI